MATATAPPQTAASTRIAALDGWRGIAILMVLVAHVEATYFGRPIPSWLNTGEHGVCIFFVLSGYLITSNLLQRGLNLRRFYIRRFFRLMPVAWAYLLFLGAAEVLVRYPRIALPEAASCLFFYRNYYGPIGTAATLHFWSLSVEEQFYLAWPLVLLLLGRRRCLQIVPVAIIGIAAWRYAHWSYYDRIYHAIL